MAKTRGKEDISGCCSNAKRDSKVWNVESVEGCKRDTNSARSMCWERRAWYWRDICESEIDCAPLYWHLQPYSRFMLSQSPKSTISPCANCMTGSQKPPLIAMPLNRICKFQCAYRTSLLIGVHIDKSFFILVSMFKDVCAAQGSAIQHEGLQDAYNTSYPRPRSK